MKMTTTLCEDITTYNILRIISIIVTDYDEQFLVILKAKSTRV